MRILGISAYFHDSAACLLVDGQVVAAAQEERFSRRKHDERFPRHAVDYCLREAGLSIAEVDHVAYFEKPFLKFERLLETHLAFAPRGLKAFLKAMPVWMGEKLWLPQVMAKELGWEGNILFAEHHESHAASAFFPSPFERAAVLTLDGVGEWATASWGVGQGNRVEIQSEMRFPHSLGLLYSAFTYFTGFKVNSGEYKLMGLAPYGEPKYVQTILDHVISLKEDGSFAMNLEYFDYAAGLKMTSRKMDQLFGGPPRQPESALTQREMDIARSIQVVTEEIVLRMARHIRKETGERYLCLAGGVALNCVANGRLLREGIFDDLYIQPASGDAGGALGAALAVQHHYLDQPRTMKPGTDWQQGSYLGTAYDDEQIRVILEGTGARMHRCADSHDLAAKTAQHIADGKIVGWFQGRMEFGPRALGSRSILGDPHVADMQRRLNVKIKFREGFRPFAPAILAGREAEWFELDRPSPYMLLVAPVAAHRRLPVSAEEEAGLTGLDRLKLQRSTIAAVTHVDGSARIQSVHADTHPLFHRLIREFEQITGCPLVVNTSFNLRGEPVVESPLQAYTCFMRTDMDVLAIGSWLLVKEEQPAWVEKENWREQFQPD